MIGFHHFLSFKFWSRLTDGRDFRLSTKRSNSLYKKKLKTNLQTCFESLSFGIITYHYIQLTFISSHFAMKKWMKEMFPIVLKTLKYHFHSQLQLESFFYSKYLITTTHLILSHSKSLSVSIYLFFLTLSHTHTLSLECPLKAVTHPQAKKHTHTDMLSKKAPRFFTLNLSKRNRERHIKYAFH